MSDTVVTISRISSYDASMIGIDVHDQKSGASLKVTMSLEDFAMCLTGVGRTPAKLDRAVHLDKWGKQRVLESVYISKPAYDGEENQKEWEQRMLIKHCPEGFEPYTHGYNNMQKFHMVFAKWEEKA